jgi:hypothetical protein
MELLQKLEALRQDPAVQWERQRKERVEAELALVRQEWRARQIEIQTTPAVYEQHVADLPTSASACSRGGWPLRSRAPKTYYSSCLL